jgi:nicotinamide riboside kinase
MANQYFVFAGPQAAGKSSLVTRVCAENQAIIPLEESRQIIVHKYQRKGAIFMTELDEIEVIHNDMTRMFVVLAHSHSAHTYVDETNVFTLAHARAHGIDLVSGYFKQYCDMLARLKAGIIFVDVPPAVSWDRRRFRYMQRLWDVSDEHREELMAKYKSYLDRLYPELLDVYHKLDCKKGIIDGCRDANHIWQDAQHLMASMA